MTFYEKLKSIAETMTGYAVIVDSNNGANVDLDKTVMPCILIVIQQNGSYETTNRHYRDNANVRINLLDKIPQDFNDSDSDPKKESLKHDLVLLYDKIKYNFEFKINGASITYDIFYDNFDANLIGAGFSDTITERIGINLACEDIEPEVPVTPSDSFCQKVSSCPVIIQIQEDIEELQNNPGGINCEDLQSCEVIQEIQSAITENTNDIESIEDSIESININLSSVTNELNDHENNTSNPHGVTKSQVGLSNVDNTSDEDKPVSTDQATAIGSVQSDIDAHESNTYNPHNVTKSQVGLSNVDNTSDASKPVSTAQQSALDLKLNAVDYVQHFLGLFTTLTNLQSAYPTANVGDYAQVDPGAGTNLQTYSWDVQDGWVLSSSDGAGANNTDQLPEGAINLYFTSSRALDAAPAETNETIGAIILSSDTVTPDGSQFFTIITDTGTIIKSKFVDVFSFLVTETSIGNFLHSLTTKSTPIDSDEIGFVDTSDSNKEKKATYLQIWNNYFKVKSDSLYQSIITAATWGSFINGLTAKTTPVDADFDIIMDSSASNIAKKVSWANRKATLKTYFDTLYQVVGTYLTASNNLSDVANKATSRVNLEIDKRTTFGDANYSVLAIDKEIVTSVTFTAPRTVILPSGLSAGKAIIIIDELQTVTSTNTLTIAVPSGKKLNGVTNGTEIITTPGGGRIIYADGSDNYIFDAGIARLNAVQTLTNKTLGTGTTILLGSDATGDLYYNGGPGALTRLAAGASGKFLRFTGVGAAPSVSTLVLPNAITTNNIVYGTGTDTVGSSVNLQFDGTQLGIGGSPVSSQPITSTSNSNGQILSRFINSSTGTAGQSSITVQNGSVGYFFTKLSSGYTTSGLLTANLNYLAGNGGDTLYANLTGSTSHIWSIGGTGTANEVFRISSSVTSQLDLKIGVVGKGLYIKEGVNATMGVSTLSSGTVTVSTTKVTANSRIILSIQSLGTVSVPTTVGVTARSAGTSFTITSASASDTSVICWQIIEPA